MAPTDDELLRDYTRTRSSAAFATLVERHLNLVYSVARRHVRSGALAEEVAQAVFVDLARDAARLKPDTPLVAWLHVVARRTAIDVARRETRRQAREVEAAQLAETMKTPEPAWAEVEPLLDEAVESLAPADRTAILLRFFENKSLREVGTVLGTSDDAAQKRVSRAVEELRAFFVRRGVAVTTAGLATTISAHATIVPPVGLGATIAATTPLASAATAEFARTVAMTTLQKSAAVLVVAAVGGFGLYEARLAAGQADHVLALREQIERASTEVRALRQEHDAANVKLGDVEKQLDARLAQSLPLSPADAALEAQMKVWLGRMDKYREVFVRYPQLNIPELAFLSAEQWNEIAGGQPLDTERQIREVTAKLRHRAEGEAAGRFSAALSAYLKAHPDTLPDRMPDLAPYCDPPVDAAVLDRWEVVRSGKLSDVPKKERGKLVAVKQPADVELDAYYWAGLNNYGNTSAVSADVSEAQRRFRGANSGQSAVTAAQLTPYLKWPLSEAVLEKLLGPTPNVRP